MKTHKCLICSLAFILSILLVGCGTAPLSMKVYDSNALKSSKSITVLDFSAEGDTLNYSGDLDSLGHVMAALLQSDLRSMTQSLEVTLGKSDNITTDLVIEGKFTKIDEGDAAGRIMVGPLGEEGVTVAVDGVVKKSDGTVVAVFNTSKTSSGGPLGMGGLLAGDSDVIIDDIMEEIAEEFTGFIIEHTSN